MGGWTTLDTVRSSAAQVTWEKADVARSAGEGGSNLAPVVASRPEAAHYTTRSLRPGRSSSVRSRIWSRSPSSSTFLISSKASPSAALASSS